jgi:hypothetical protein
MVPNPEREDGSPSANIEIRSILWNSKVRSRTDQNPPLQPLKNHTNTAHIIPRCCITHEITQV